MDIGLKLLYIKGLIQKNIWKVKLTREELQEKRPSAVAYINGAKDTDEDRTKNHTGLVKGSTNNI